MCMCIYEYVSKDVPSVAQVYPFLSSSLYITFSYENQYSNTIGNHYVSTVYGYLYLLSIMPHLQ